MKSEMGGQKIALGEIPGCARRSIARTRAGMPLILRKNLLPFLAWMSPLWRASGLVVLGVGLLASACAAGKGGGPTTAPSGPDRVPNEPRDLAPRGHTVPEVTRDDWGLHTHRKLVLRPQNLVLSLPQGNLWEPQTRRGTWSVLRHDPSESELLIRHAPARRTVTIDECEKEARLSLELIRHREPEAVERRLAAPAGYGGQLRVILLPDGGGRVEAFSVGVSRCLAVVFTTGGQPGFPERLRVAVNEVIETMRVPNIGERGAARRMSPY